MTDVRTALSRGADINCKGGIYVEPVLMRAVWAKRDDVVAFLLEQPGILDVVQDEERLMYIAQWVEYLARQARAEPEKKHGR